MRWFVRGDVDGFFGLALDNLVQLLVIDALCRHALGFPAELVRGTILPGAAISVLVGNLFYSWQAMRLARRTGRTDVTALPFGINTVSLFAFVFLVMLPARLAAQRAPAASSRPPWGRCGTETATPCRAGMAGSTPWARHCGPQVPVRPMSPR